MIFEFFVLGVIFGAIFLYLGLSNTSFGFAYLGMFCFLLMGLFLYSDGISIVSGTAESPIGSHNFIDTYTNYTTSNSPVVNLLAATFLYLPFGAILLTTFVALRG